MTVRGILDYCLLKDSNLDIGVMLEYLRLAREDFLNDVELLIKSVEVTTSTDASSLAFSTIDTDNLIINIYGVDGWEAVNSFFFKFPGFSNNTTNKYTVINDKIEFNKIVDSGTVLKIKYSYVPNLDGAAIVDADLNDIPAKYHRLLTDYVLSECYDSREPNIADRYMVKYESGKLQAKIDIKEQALKIETEEVITEDAFVNYLNAWKDSMIGLEVLPAASADWLGKIVAVRTGVGEKTITYVCVVNSSNDYSWIQINVSD